MKIWHKSILTTVNVRTDRYKKVDSFDDPTKSAKLELYIEDVTRALDNIELTGKALLHQADRILNTESMAAQHYCSDELARLEADLLQVVTRLRKYRLTK